MRLISDNLKPLRLHPLIVDFLEKNVGKRAVDVVSFYFKKDMALEADEVAKNTNVSLTEVRSILNRLHYRGIVNYTKKKDSKSGWYSYVWAINKKELLDLVILEKTEELERLKKKINNIKDYSLLRCSNNCGEIVFEIASQYDFKCPDCSSSLILIDKNKLMKETTIKINKLEKGLKEIKK